MRGSVLSIIELSFQLGEEARSTLDMPEEDELTCLRKYHNRLTNHLEILIYYGIGNGIFGLLVYSACAFGGPLKDYFREQENPSGLPNRCSCYSFSRT